MTRCGRPLAATALASLLAIAVVGGHAAVAAESAPSDPHVQLFARAVATTSEFSAAFVQERDGISVIALDGDYDRGLAEPRAELARAFYERHGDDYDFLVVFTSFPFPMGGAAAFASLVRNDVQGIGVSVFDNGAAFGSDSRLGAIVDMGRLESWSTQPSEPRFETTLTTLLHELQHRWGARVRFRQADGTLSTALLGRDGAHWSYLLDSDASVHYGHDWRDNGDGTFTADAIERRLSPLDLYLAGFAPPSEVPPFFLDSPGVDPTQLPRLHATIGGTKRAVTIEQVIGAEGPRIPAASAAPRKLRTAFLLVLRPGQVPSEAQIQGIARVRRELPARFAAATSVADPAPRSPRRPTADWHSQSIVKELIPSVHGGANVT